MAEEQPTLFDDDGQGPQSAKRRGRRLTDAQKQEICDRYAAGYTSNHIAEVMDTTCTTVIAILQKFGVHDPSRNGSKRFTDEQHQQMVNMAKAGKTAKEIATEFNCPYGTVHVVLNNAGYYLHRVQQLTDQQKDEICDLYQTTDKAVTAIARTYKVSGAVVMLALEIRGIPKRHRDFRVEGNYEQKISKADVQAIIDRYQAGEAAADIAVRYNVTLTTIAYWLNKYGAIDCVRPRVVRKERRGPLTDEEKEFIKTRYMAEEDIKTIAADFKVETVTIYRTVKAMGLRRVSSCYKLTSEQRDEIAARYQAGETIVRLAAEYGVGSNSVQSCINRRCPERRTRKTGTPNPPRMCVDCKVNEVSVRKHLCESCRALRRTAAVASSHHTRVSMGRCRGCSQEVDQKGSLCQECTRKIKARNEAIKLRCFAGYGGQCRCCAQKFLTFLTIDHVNNNGAKDRRKAHLGSQFTTGTRLYRWIIKNNFPDTFQILCWNCQWGKRMSPDKKCPCQNLGV